MTKSPEQYFQEQNFAPAETAGAVPGQYTEAERAFMEKYIGIDAPDALKKLGIDPVDPPSVMGGAAAPALQAEAAQAQEEEPLDDVLRRTQGLLMVGFFLGRQEFVVPTLAVQEVIRSQVSAKLPAAPAFVAGVINLRGKVTPLIHLRDMLETPVDKNTTEGLFTIVCRRKGLQLGLIIDRVHTMYRVAQEDIDWAVEAHLGANVDFISGLLKLRDQLIGIVSVDRIVDAIIKR